MSAPIAKTRLDGNLRHGQTEGASFISALVIPLTVASYRAAPRTANFGSLRSKPTATPSGGSISPARSSARRSRRQSPSPNTCRRPSPSTPTPSARRTRATKGPPSTTFESTRRGLLRPTGRSSRRRSNPSGPSRGSSPAARPSVRGTTRRRTRPTPSSTTAIRSWSQPAVPRLPRSGCSQRSGFSMRSPRPSSHWPTISSRVRSSFPRAKEDWLLPALC